MRRVAAMPDAVLTEGAQDDASPLGLDLGGLHRVRDLLTGHRSCGGPDPDEGLQCLVGELRGKSAELGGCHGHRRHQQPFVARYRDPGAQSNAGAGWGEVLCDTVSSGREGLGRA